MNILITGTSRGIGYELVRKFATLPGNTIFAVSRNSEKTNELARLCNQQNNESQVIPLIYDLSEFENISPLIQEMSKTRTILDILINNAGYLVNKPFNDLTQTDIEAIYRVNVTMPMLLTQNLIPFLSASKLAHIINISSMGGFQGSAKFAGLSAYASSKAAIAGFTECLAEELKGTNIKVNCLALGAVNTEMLNEAFPGYSAMLNANEMANYIYDFACTGHHFFNGKILPVSISTP